MKTLTLSQVREIMISRNIATLSMERDQVAIARRVIGNANACNPYLSNMIKALSLMTWDNTVDDWKRLEAAIIVRAHCGARRIT